MLRRIDAPVWLFRERHRTGIVRSCGGTYQSPTAFCHATIWITCGLASCKAPVGRILFLDSYRAPLVYALSATHCIVSSMFFLGTADAGRYGYAVVNTV